MRQSERSGGKNGSGRGGAAPWGRADGGVICVGCGRWGKHGCLSVVSDTSGSERNQFRAGRGCRAYNNWILLLAISFTIALLCSESCTATGIQKGNEEEKGVQIFPRRLKYLYSKSEVDVEKKSCLFVCPRDSDLSDASVLSEPHDTINNHNC